MLKSEHITLFLLLSCGENPSIMKTVIYFLFSYLPHLLPFFPQDFLDAFMGIPLGLVGKSSVRTLL